MLPALPSLLVSILALLLAGLSFRYSRRKDSAARQQSIQDDFWLRKVISPAAIEPFVKFSSNVIAGLPRIDGEGISAAAVAQFFRDQQAQLI
ncbi:MAG: hypothetical protein ACRDIC_24385 [bacterium]